MNICFLMHYFYRDKVGGSEVQSFLVARELAKRGHRVWYICEDFDKEAPREELVDGIWVCRGIKWRKALRILAITTVWRELRRTDADVCYQRFASPYTGMVALMSKLLGKRFVWACSEDGTLSRWYFTRSLLDHFRSYSGDSLKKAALFADSVLNDLLYAFGVNRANEVVVQNLTQQAALAKEFGRHGSILKSGHVPVKGAILKPTPPIVLWLSAISRRKQPELFVELARRCQNLNCKFLMVGRTPKRWYLEQVLERAHGLPNFEYRDGVGFEGSSDYFYQASIYVSTSSGEGFPNVFVQSWLAETPVVSFVDPDSLIERQELGRSVRSFDDMVRNVEYLIGNSVERERIGRRARAYAEAEHNIERIADDHEELFRRIVEKPGLG